VKVRYADRAQADIENIHAYIHERNPRAATAVIQRIRQATERLGMRPYLGHAGRVRGTLEWVVAPLPYITYIGSMKP
jgi:plasmid stabilization system protein ParE